MSLDGKRKKDIVKSSFNPTWEEKFTFENLKVEDLSNEHVLEITLWNRISDTFIGGLHLGPASGSATKCKDWMDSIGEEVSHWEEMLAHHGEWVERWHTLRETMKSAAHFCD